MRNNKLTKQFVTFLAVIAVCLSMIPTTSIHAVDVDLNTLKLRCLASMSKKVILEICIYIIQMVQK